MKTKFRLIWLHCWKNIKIKVLHFQWFWVYLLISCIFKLPSFSATMNKRQFLTFNFILQCNRSCDVCANGSSESPSQKKPVIYLAKNGIILIKYEFTNWILLFWCSKCYKRQRGSTGKFSKSDSRTTKFTHGLSFMALWAAKSRIQFLKECSKRLQLD